LQQEKGRRWKSYLLDVTEFAKGSLDTVEKALEQTKTPFPRSSLLTVIHDVCMGMTYLHSFSAIHRDLKPDNLLVFDPWVIKVCDFGVITEVSEDLENTKTAGMGTKWYMAPEIHTGKFNCLCDVYSFVILLAKLNGIPKLTFEKITLEEKSRCAEALDIPEEELTTLRLTGPLLENLVNSRYEAKQTILGLLTDLPELIDCLSVAAEKRKTFHELLQGFVCRGLHERMERKDPIVW
jgi:serine/threonine protein kinase